MSIEFDLLVKFSEGGLFIEQSRADPSDTIAMIDSSWVVLTPEERAVMEQVARALQDEEP